MFIYFVISFLLIIFSCGKRSKTQGVIIFTLMFFVSFYRDIKVGIDTYAYYMNDITYGIIGDTSMSYSYELGFLLFRRFIDDYNLPPRWCLFGLVILTFFFLWKASKRYKVNLVLLCLFFYLFNFYFLSMNIARQITASSILLYGYSFLKEEKKHYYYIPLVLLAASFHLSSLLFILVYFVRFVPDIPIRDNKKYLYAIFTILFVACVFADRWIMSKLSGFIVGADSYGRFDEEMSTSSRSLITLVLDYVIMLMNVKVYLWLISFKEYNVLSKLFLISILATMCFGT